MSITKIQNFHQFFNRPSKLSMDPLPPANGLHLELYLITLERIRDDGVRLGRLRSVWGRSTWSFLSDRKHLSTITRRRWIYRGLVEAGYSERERGPNPGTTLPVTSSFNVVMDFANTYNSHYSNAGKPWVYLSTPKTRNLDRRSFARVGLRLATYAKRKTR